MRPVDKGPSPKTEYNPYGKALDDLTRQLGFFCSYCEQPITHVPEVEHVQPKSLAPHLRFRWDNFLLSCKSCNTVKSRRPANPVTVALPDVDNTFSALEYHPDGRITVKAGLDEITTSLIEETIKLVKLHRHPSAAKRGDRPSARDKRVDFRLDVWNLATLMLKRYESDPNTGDLIAEQLAPAKGFFSIWMTVFTDHPVMLKRFIAAFPGTDQNSFDANGRPIHRPTGRF